MRVARYIKLEKLKYRKYHIVDFNRIVKLLYPYRSTVNKYVILLKRTTFTKSQKQLLLQTIHSLTIINESYRYKDTMNRLYSDKEDVINAVIMLQNELNLKDQSLLLPVNVRWFYGELCKYFGGLDFTLRQVQFKLLKSKSSCRRYVIELVDRGMVLRIGKQGQCHVYCIAEKEVSDG